MYSSVGIPIGCNDVLTISGRHTLSRRLGLRHRPSEKVNLGPLEEVNPILKLIVWVKSLFLTNSRVLISNMIIVP